MFSKILGILGYALSASGPVLVAFGITSPIGVALSTVGGVILHFQPQPGKQP